jgi:hypothetical protein
MALSVSNWVSTKVMRAELSAFQRELEDMMRGGAPALPLGNWAGNGAGGVGGGEDDGGDGAGTV